MVAAPTIEHYSAGQVEKDGTRLKRHLSCSDIYRSYLKGKIMFNTYHLHKHATTHDYSKVAEQMQFDRESRERISENEIKSKNRVDISLEEYEKMKFENEDLKRKLYTLENKVEPFKEILELNILPDTLYIDHHKKENIMGYSEEMRCIIIFDYK